ncbi:MAG: AIM24 family protein [Myxococcota bacterium]
MQSAIEHGPSFAWLRVELEPGETIEAESGAMVTGSAALEMQTGLKAGRKAGIVRKLLAILIALARKIFGGETLNAQRTRACRVPRAVPADQEEHLSIRIDYKARGRPASRETGRPRCNGRLERVMLRAARRSSERVLSGSPRRWQARASGDLR